MTAPISPRPPAPAAQPTLWRSMAFQAFLGSLFAACCPPLGLYGFIGGIVAISRSRTEGRKGLAIAAVVLSLFTWTAFLLPSLPGFFAFQRRAKQGECKSLLKQQFTAKLDQASSEQGLTADLAPTFEPLRYYVLASSTNVDDPRTVNLSATKLDPEELARIKRELPAVLAEVKPGLSGTCPDCSVTVACVSNLDGDDDLDLWSISTADRTLGGVNVERGEVHPHLDDTLPR